MQELVQSGSLIWGGGSTQFKTPPRGPLTKAAIVGVTRLVGSPFYNTASGQILNLSPYRVSQNKYLKALEE
jgi:hypothetical protein